ncbi:MAG TPA: hypothetical protein VIR03_02145 [Candidatus Saccharimonadales bacterium]
MDPVSKEKPFSAANVAAATGERMPTQYATSPAEAQPLRPAETPRVPLAGVVQAPEGALPAVGTDQAYRPQLTTGVGRHDLSPGFSAAAQQSAAPGQEAPAPIATEQQPPLPPEAPQA